jgi:hypothetical protein
MPLPISRSKPSTATRRHDTPVARIRLFARTLSSPSRKTSRLCGSTRATVRVTRISAPRRRACCSARLASSSPETPFGKPR